jgi:RNA polymerase sigma-70 factor, ECF subfamily
MPIHGTDWPRVTTPNILHRRGRIGDDRHGHVKTGCNAMSTDQTRVSVILGVRHRDPERWREFDAIYRPLLFAYLSKRGVSAADAGDLIQEIFVKLLLKIGTYDRTLCRFRTWLFRITQNALIDRARRKASREKAHTGWAEHVLEASPSDRVAMELEFQKLHREKILAHALKVVRTQVTPKAWACFEQRLLKDRSAIDIGADLKLSPNAVYVNASGVMKQVRQICVEFDEDISHAREPDLS